MHLEKKYGIRRKHIAAGHSTFCLSDGFSFGWRRSQKARDRAESRRRRAPGANGSSASPSSRRRRPPTTLFKKVSQVGQAPPANTAAILVMWNSGDAGGWGSGGATFEVTRAPFSEISIAETLARDPEFHRQPMRLAAETLRKDAENYPVLVDQENSGAVIRTSLKND
ncbi:hypothetical protein ABIB75_007675 [Bradyrhizobium sp. GM2.2]|uniref:hypothetical protein n=1 Tax=Bradyrhizobium sp. GM2.2 TaxID=3156358 RepID=UPI003394E31B